MSYIGRVVGIGATQDGNPVLLYGLSGRSPSSRSRIAKIHGSRVSIEPYGEMTPEQKAESGRLVYDAIMTTGQYRTDLIAFGVVSNGRQTRSIFRKYSKRGFGNTLDMRLDTVGKTLQRWGHEGKVGDRYNTPRIAGDVEPSMFVSGMLGIVTDKSEFPKNVERVSPGRGFANYLSTYTGEGTEPKAPIFNKMSEIIKHRRIEGESARELAEEMYAFMDPDFVVATAAAIWTPFMGKGWELAVKNKN